MSQTFLGAVDQGTTSTRFIVFDSEGNLVASSQIEFTQHFPHSGWVEHDAEEIYQSVLKCMSSPSVTAYPIKAIGITNQRETAVAWSSATGKPLYRAIVWQDTRTIDIVRQYTDKAVFQHVTGLPVANYFSALKFKWMLDHVPAVQEAARDGSLRLGTIDSWLIYKLTGGKRHVTDVSNASRTLLMDIHTLRWSQSMCAEFGINMEWLPEIIPSCYDLGSVEDGPMAGTMIGGCIGDQQGSLIGQRCFHPGQAKNTYGTGCFILLNTGPRAPISRHGLITTVAFQVGQTTCYAMEGSIAIAGAGVRWLKDGLGIIQSSAEIETLARQVPSTDGVHFVPAFSGLFAPRWRDDARGVIVGLSHGSNKSHLARAVLEAVSFQTREILDAMSLDSNTHLEALKVDGGMTENDLLMQIQADIAHLPIKRPKMRETTALGAAMLAGVASGVYKGLEDVRHHIPDRDMETFEPQISPEESKSRLKVWKKAVDKSLGWVEQ